MPLLSMPTKNILRVDVKCGPALVWHRDDDVGAPPDNSSIYLIDFITHNNTIPTTL